MRVESTAMDKPLFSHRKKALFHDFRENWRMSTTHHRPFGDVFQHAHLRHFLTFLLERGKSISLPRSSIKIVPEEEEQRLRA